MGARFNYRHNPAVETQVSAVRTTVWPLCHLKRRVTALPTAKPTCSADKLSVSVCLIACLGGILTEFQLEFALIELRPGLQKAEPRQNREREGGWEGAERANGLENTTSSNRKSLDARRTPRRRKGERKTTTRRTHNHVRAQA